MFAAVHRRHSIWARRRGVLLPLSAGVEGWVEHSKHIACPILFVAGNDDFICGPTQARLLVGHNPIATTVVLADCGHFVMLVAPDAYRDAVTHLLGTFG
jgi:pimeloyl-ACP methyl ester carboxylesterase